MTPAGCVLFQFLYFIFMFTHLNRSSALLPGSGFVKVRGLTLKSTNRGLYFDAGASMSGHACRMPHNPSCAPVVKDNRPKMALKMPYLRLLRLLRFQNQKMPNSVILRNSALFKVGSSILNYLRLLRFIGFH
jgi:hypothetical protein